MQKMKQLKRYGVIADYMHLGGNSDDEKVALLIAYLRKMNDELNIPHSINHYGADGLPADTGFVSEDVFLARVDNIAALAIEDACTGSNPRIPTQEEMAELLKACYYDSEVDFKKIKTFSDFRQGSKGLVFSFVLSKEYTIIS